MRRKDLCADTVSANNVFLSSHLGNKFKKTKMIKRADFDDNCEYHFDKKGEGFRHMAALILSVLQEFTEYDCWQ